MAFYSVDASMGQRLASLVQWLELAEGAGQAGGLSITWVRYSRSLLPEGRTASSDQGASLSSPGSGPDHPRGHGASWNGEQLRDPGDLVQFPYLIATERWLQRELLEEEPELRRALQVMTTQGSHDATAYVVDRLSGTTGGPSLAPHRRGAWHQQRQLVNAWLASLGWPELQGCNASQKTWQEGPYGRERDGMGQEGEHANRFSSDGLARLLEAVLAGTLISPPACGRMRALLAGPTGSREDAPALPATLAPLLPGALPSGWRLWGKGGHRSTAVQLAVYREVEGLAPTLLVVLAKGLQAAAAARLLSRIVGELFHADAPATPMT